MSPRKLKNVMSDKTRAAGEGLANVIDKSIPDNHGFALFIFEYGQPDGNKQISYISNARRDDMIAMMKDWLAVQEGRSMDTPERIQ